jgi:hypothetical protein
MEKKNILLVLGAVFLPLVIQTASMLHRFQNPEIRSVVFVMGLTGGFSVGLLCLLAIQMELRYRIYMALAYWPIMCVIMCYFQGIL